MRLEIAVGGREHAHVACGSARAPPDALEAALLQRAQQLDLQLGRHVADLVEEDVPPWASSSLPSRRSLASVNAPFSWPNSSDSSRVAGNGRAEMPTKGRPARRL